MAVGINIYGCSLMTAWLWQWPETVWVLDKTLNHNIKFMNQYAQYKFHYSSPQFYEWMKIIGKYAIP